MGLEYQYFWEDTIPSTAKSIKDICTYRGCIVRKNGDCGGCSPFLINGRKAALCLEMDGTPSQKVAHYKHNPEKSSKGIARSWHSQYLARMKREAWGSWKTLFLYQSGVERRCLSFSLSSIISIILSLFECQFMSAMHVFIVS